MANATLGVRTADGSIASVLDFRRAVSGGTVFTTTVDGQRRAVFDFYYRGAAGWTYLDSLSLPHLPPAPAGEPDLQVEARLDSAGNLLLQMHDPRSPQPVRFLLEAARLRRLLRSTPGAQKWRMRMLAALGLAAALLAGGLALLPGHRGASGRLQAPPPVPTASSAREASAQPEPQPREAQLPEPAERAQPASLAKPPAGPPAPPAPPAAAPRASTIPARLPADRHSIAWGDTLWRIAERYYGERELYRELARSNRLADPDRIIAGRTLLLPPALGKSSLTPPGAQR